MYKHTAGAGLRRGDNAAHVHLLTGLGGAHCNAQQSQWQRQVAVGPNNSLFVLLTIVRYWVG
jgi:hypothetical protein